MVAIFREQLCSTDKLPGIVYKATTLRITQTGSRGGRNLEGAVLWKLSPIAITSFLAELASIEEGQKILLTMEISQLIKVDDSIPLRSKSCYFRRVNMATN